MKNSKNKFEKLRFFWRSRHYIKAFLQTRKIKPILTLVNVELGKLRHSDPIYAQRIDEFNHLMVTFFKARWHAENANRTNLKKDWKIVFEGFKKSKKHGNKLLSLLRLNDNSPLVIEKNTFSSENTEIMFADDVPLIPEINPIIILQGTDYEMGYQYAQQLIQIFGPWILEKKAQVKFTDDERIILQKWEKEIATYAPEILELCKGWAAGASAAGVTMSYEDVLDIWTGHIPPAKYYFGLGEELLRLPTLACSGIAAWGQATPDGKLVTGSSGDHDATHTVSIIAFPKTGNNFIYTPFGATGDVPLIGNCYMFGHPGMNNKGLAYVHHGGGPKLIEPMEFWGYGLRRAVSVLHILRFANNAKEAQQLEMSYPIGDIGNTDYACVGGFYADNNYAYAIESRKAPILIRETGLMGEKDFLYANNSSIHPNANQAAWMSKEKDGWVWDKHGGWYPKTFDFFQPFKRGKPEVRVIKGLKFSYQNSCCRNRYAFNMITRAFGHIDLNYIKLMYRNSGTIPEGSWKKVSRNYFKTGKWGKISIGHASNALVTVMKPDDGNEGLYQLCIGPAARGVTPMHPTHGSSIYYETNTFWEIKLASSPEKVAEYAKQKAQELITKAIEKLENVGNQNSQLTKLKEFALNEFNIGSKFEKIVEHSTGNDALYNWAKATRAFTRAQVRAKQIYNILIPPPIN